MFTTQNSWLSHIQITHYFIRKIVLSQPKHQKIAIQENFYTKGSVDIFNNVHDHCLIYYRYIICIVIFFKFINITIV